VMAAKPLIIIDYEKGFDQSMSDCQRCELPMLRAKSGSELLRHIKTLLHDRMALAAMKKRMDDYNARILKTGDSTAEVGRLIMRLVRNRK
jgi:hypothetical protein